MIEEAYVSFETAKLLKEKGFSGECLSMYVTPKPRSGMGNPNEAKLAPHGRDSHYYEGYIYQCEAPTQQMAMRWLREVHNIKVNIFYNNSNYTIEYFEPNTQTGVGKFVFIGDGYNVYEQACEAAIKYCLENLILL